MASPRARIGSRAFAAATGLALAVLGSACTHREVRRLDIVAGPVSRDASGLTGWFRVEPAASGIPSRGHGGACLLMQPAGEAVRRCRVDADCTGAATLAGSSGYCLDRDDADAGGRCWVRPGPATRYCRQYKEARAPLGQELVFPVDASGAPAPAPEQPGRWRVHACLNGASGQLTCPVPEHPDRRLHDGPVRTVPALPAV